MEEELCSREGQISKSNPQARRASMDSLESGSEGSSSSSVHGRDSLVQVMSLEGNSMKDDIYEYYLIEQGRKPTRNSNSSRRASGNDSAMDSQESIPQRRSSSSRVLAHECLCDDGNCLGFHCPCYNEQNEMCLNHNCCPICVKMKNETFQLQQPKAGLGQKKLRQGKFACACAQLREKTGDKSLVCRCYEKYPILLDSQKDSKPQKNAKAKTFQQTKSNKIMPIGCSCKKSHCLKKYCHCFAMNNKCSPQCQCQDCQNDFDNHQEQDQIYNDKLRYSNANEHLSSESEKSDVDIDQYLEEKNYQDIMMPISMEFQHPDLKNAYHV